MELDFPMRRRRSVDHDELHHDKQHHHLDFIPSGTLGFRHPSTWASSSQLSLYSDSSTTSSSGLVSWDASTLESSDLPNQHQQPQPSFHKHHHHHEQGKQPHPYSFHSNSKTFHRDLPQDDKAVVHSRPPEMKRTTRDRYGFDATGTSISHDVDPADRSSVTTDKTGTTATSYHNPHHLYSTERQEDGLSDSEAQILYEIQQVLTEHVHEQRQRTNSDDGQYDVDMLRGSSSHHHTSSPATRPSLRNAFLPGAEDQPWGTVDMRMLQSFRSILSGAEQSLQSHTTGQYEGKKVLGGEYFEESGDGSRRYAKRMDEDGDSSFLQSHLRRLHTIEGVEAALSDIMQNKQYQSGSVGQELYRPQRDLPGMSQASLSSDVRSVADSETTSGGLLPLHSQRATKSTEANNNNKSKNTNSKLKLTDLFLWSDKQNVDVEVARRASVGEETYASSKQQRHAEMTGDRMDAPNTGRATQERRSSAGHPNSASNRRLSDHLQPKRTGAMDGGMRGRPSHSSTMQMPRRPSITVPSASAAYDHHHPHQVRPVQYQNQIPSASQHQTLKKQASTDQITHVGTVTDIERTSLWEQSTAQQQLDLFAVWPEAHRQLGYSAEEAFDSDADSEDPIFERGSVASSDDEHSTLPLMMNEPTSSIHTRGSAVGVKRFFKMAKRRFSKKG